MKTPVYDKETMAPQLMAGDVTTPTGFTANGVHCGIRKNKTKRDLALIMADRPCSAAAMYTENRVKSAPIYVTMENLRNKTARAILVNSGNANACAPSGRKAAEQSIAAAANATGLQPTDFIVNSTGVIGQPLPVDAIVSGIPALVAGLSTEGGAAAADAIMTTDTFSKTAAVQIVLDGKTVTLGGIAKGSGMINPNLATMLAYITTDCAIEPNQLREALLYATKRSFNRICVDGDTSTNDMVAILANGAAGNNEIASKSFAFTAFKEALRVLCLALAKDIARDGEGATKFITCRVNQAPSPRGAVALAKSVVSSSLVKAAMFGADANWGRVMCALGNTSVSFNPDTVSVAFSSEAGHVVVGTEGKGIPFDETQAKAVLSQRDILIEVDMNHGKSAAEAYGCDLTYDYVKINGDYRT